MHQVAHGTVSRAVWQLYACHDTGFNCRHAHHPTTHNSLDPWTPAQRTTSRATPPTPHTGTTASGEQPGTSGGRKPQSPPHVAGQQPPVRSPTHGTPQGSARGHGGSLGPGGGLESAPSMSCMSEAGLRAVIAREGADEAEGRGLAKEMFPLVYNYNLHREKVGLG